MLSEVSRKPDRLDPGELMSELADNLIAMARSAIPNKNNLADIKLAPLRSYLFYGQGL
ncbi:unannotated protein [freshwater metagenome]|uniref:Unannotated protein n=1 Tax=freshwater metagenome TaxID=449393 RepID=A0A6J7GDI1_9ZZZZ